MSRHEEIMELMGTNPDAVADSLIEIEHRLSDAELILEQLSSGYSRFMLNEIHEGQKIGDQVIDYWRKWSGDNTENERPK